MPECTCDSEMPPVVRTALSALNYLQLIELDQVHPDGHAVRIGRTGRPLTETERYARDRAFTVLSAYFDEAIDEYEEAYAAAGMTDDDDDDADGEDAESSDA